VQALLREKAAGGGELAIATELQHVPRALSTLSYLRVRGHTAEESFPSGDAAGAAAFSASLVFAAGVPVVVAALLALCTMHGRVYLWAHHLSDVVAGCVLGVCSTAALETSIGARQFGIGHLIATSVLIGVAQGATDRGFRGLA
jgi:hypothetical protein